jgi:hypothetical protein
VGKHPSGAGTLEIEVTRGHWNLEELVGFGVLMAVTMKSIIVFWDVAPHSSEEQIVSIFRYRQRIACFC